MDHSAKWVLPKYVANGLAKMVTLVPHLVLLLILNKINLLIWMFNMKIHLKIIKMLDQVLVLEIKKKGCKPCLVLKD